MLHTSTNTNATTITEIIIIATLLTVFVIALFDKKGWLDKFAKWGANQKSKFIYRLSSCEFCIRFHLGTICSILVVLLWFINIEYLLTPFCVAGAFKLIRYDNKA